jgi:hypothetical protein
MLIGSGRDPGSCQCPAQLGVLVFQRKGARVSIDGEATADLKGTDLVASLGKGHASRPLTIAHRVVGLSGHDLAAHAITTAVGAF